MQYHGFVEQFARAQPCAFEHVAVPHFGREVDVVVVHHAENLLAGINVVLLRRRDIPFVCLDMVLRLVIFTVEVQVAQHISRHRRTAVGSLLKGGYVACNLLRPPIFAYFVPILHALYSVQHHAVGVAMLDALFQIEVVAPFIDEVLAFAVVAHADGHIAPGRLHAMACRQFEVVAGGLTALQTFGG